MNPSQRRHYAISLHQAAQESPTLAHLSERLRASSQRFKAIQAVLPPALRHSVVAGPLDESNWCLLVNNNATASKLRQLLPTLQAHLQSHDLPVNGIRIKVQTRSA